jgi:uncharacterized protein YndB with AHSA1/START domain
VTHDRHGSAVIEFPSELEVLITRQFEAPIALVFDVLTKTDHVRHTIAPFGEEVKACSFDPRVGGNYHYVFVSDDGRDMSFHGTFVEVQPPTRIVDTWLYDGWPDVEAVESVDLDEADGVTTTVKWRLAFSDKAGRDHMTRFDGIEANFDNVEDYLRSLLDQKASVSG